MLNNAQSGPLKVHDLLEAVNFPPRCAALDTFNASHLGLRVMPGALLAGFLAGRHGVRPQQDACQPTV
jgi:hypothetical protein